MKLFIFSILFLLVSGANARKVKDFPVGKIIKLRGKVSVLQPHTLKATWLKQGSFVYEDSSILSEKRSFALIKMIDGSRVTVGPKSKIVLSLVKKKSGTIISLLTGKLRAAVAKKKQKHFFVETRTAALGVRGTEFVTTYNAASHKTGLLTYEGSVAIKKVAKKIIIDNESTDKEKRQVVKEISKLLQQKPLVAKVGDFTNVGVMSKEAAPVVKVNVKQLSRLKLDTSLGAEKLKVSKKEIKKVEAELTKQIKKELVTTTKKQTMANGGLVDLDTGLYIPPAKPGKVIGKIDNNGKYIPPKGLKLDPHKGFVAIKKDAEDKAEKLNEKLEDQVVPEPDNPAYRRYFD